MRRNLPYEFFLRYLLAVGSAEAASACLLGLGYPAPELEELKLRKSALLGDRPSSLSSQHKEVNDWLIRKGIHGLYRNTKDAHAALSLMTDPRKRYVLEMLLISGMSCEVVTNYYEEVTGEPISPGVAKLFEHYFWNRSLMASEDWRAFLLKEKQGCKSTYYVDNYRDGNDLFRAFLGDGELALFKLGVRAPLTSEEMLDNIIQMTYAKIMDTRSDNNSEFNAKKLNQLWGVLDGALERRGKTGAAMSRVMDEVHNISLMLRRNEVKDVSAYLAENAKVGLLPQKTASKIEIEERANV